ncbi:MAG: hypothetical protein PHC49_18455 [Desulfuromonadaceae bacterium]|nr:hypothetical protein [Desulfuromonadaceae bacterium]
MNERPLNQALTAWTDTTFQEFWEAVVNGQPYDWSGWTELEFVIAESQLATKVAITGTVTAEAGKLTVTVDEATLKAALPASEKNKTFVFALRGRPTGTYRIRAIYGPFTINRGLPDAA